MWLDTYKLSPCIKKHQVIVRFSADSGKVKHTPVKTATIDNPYHYDFYKSLSFDLAKMTIVDIISLQELYEAHKQTNHD